MFLVYMVKDALGLRTKLPEDIQLLVEEQLEQVWRTVLGESFKQLYCAAALMRLRRSLKRDVQLYGDTIDRLASCGSERERRNKMPDVFLVLSGLSASILRTLGQYPSCLKRRCDLVPRWVLLNAQSAILAGTASLLSNEARWSTRTYDMQRYQCFTWRNRLISFVDKMIERRYLGITPKYQIEVSLLSRRFRSMQFIFMKRSLARSYPKFIALATPFSVQK